ncbi:hypothetical protein U1Q18_009877 [Sarracenia purpurea var. burkii]
MSPNRFSVLESLGAENALESVERLTRVSKKQKGSVCEGFLKGGACDGILKRDPSQISEDDLDAQIALADIRQDAAQARIDLLNVARDLSLDRKIIQGVVKTAKSIQIEINRASSLKSIDIVDLRKRIQLLKNSSPVRLNSGKSSLLSEEVKISNSRDALVMPSDEVPVKTVGTGPGNFLKVHCEAENVSASKVFDILPQRKPASCLAVNDTGKDVKSAEGFFPGSFGDVVKSEEKEIVSDEDEEGSEEDYTTEEDDGNNEGDSEVNDDRHAIALGFTKECSEVISNGEIKLNHVENCYEVVDLERKEVSAVKRKQTEDKEVQVIDAHQVFDGRPETFFGKEKQGSALDVDRISISESPLPGFCALEVGLNGGPGVDAMKTHRGNKGDKHNHMLDTLTGPIADANTAAVSHQVFGAEAKETCFGIFAPATSRHWADMCSRDG